VIAADAYRWARGFEPIDDEPIVVLIDPPYRDFEDHPAKVNQLLLDLVHKLPAQSIIAVESRRALDESLLPDPELWDIRRYGGTQVAIRFPAEDDDVKTNAGSELETEGKPEPTESNAPPPLDGPNA
jgi:16S rRNA (guanine966-N2)-methyltransferase